jgi:hypothetical protein
MPDNPNKKPYSQAWKVTLALFIILAPLIVSSQVIGNWDFTNTITGTGSSFNSVSNADFSPSIPVRAFNGGSEYYGHDGWPVGAIDLTRYLEFTLTPNTGYALNLLSLVLRMRHSNTGPSGGSGPTRFSVRSSLDGFSADIASGNITGAYANFTITPGTSFHHLPTATTFRVYGYMAVIYSGGNNRFVFDNMQVTAIGLILPVRLISFSARPDRNEVLINYSIGNATAGSVYTLERSSEGTHFRPRSINTETGDAGLANYSVTDKDFHTERTLLYYRLKIHELTGSISYSPIVTANRSTAGKPVNTSISGNVLKLYGALPANFELAIFSSSGKCVFRQQIQTRTSINNYTCPVPVFPAGVYHMSMINATSRQSTSLFIP